MSTAEAMKMIMAERGFPRSAYHWWQLSGLPKSTFDSVYYGRRLPSVVVALKIAQAGGVTVEHIFGGLDLK